MRCFSAQLILTLGLWCESTACSALQDAPPQAQREARPMHSVELRITAPPRVEEGDNEAWLVVPIQLSNPSAEPVEIRSVFKGCPNIYSYGLCCESGDFAVQDYLPINNACFFSITLPPEQMVAYAFKYRILKAKPGNYHCRIRPLSKNVNEVEFDITIPPGLYKDEPLPEKRYIPPTDTKAEPSAQQRQQQEQARREMYREGLLHALRQAQVARLRVVTQDTVHYIRLSKEELGEVQRCLAHLGLVPQVARPEGEGDMLLGSLAEQGRVWLELCDARGCEMRTLGLTQGYLTESEIPVHAGKYGAPILFLPDADDAAIRALPSVQKAAGLLRADKAHKTADSPAYINWALL